jgi:Transglutaminase-like superfamily
MTFLVFKAYLTLIYFDFYLVGKNFPGLYEKVRRYRTQRRTAAGDTVERLCSAVDLACVWYWKEVRCLQRSAVTACLLRKRGVAAQLVLGAQQIPFKAHAWVEVDGHVVNDKPYMQEIYEVLDRC